MLNNCLPLAFQKAGKVFLMPCTGLLPIPITFDDTRPGDSSVQRSSSLCPDKGLLELVKFQLSYNRWVVLLCLQWLSWVHVFHAPHVDRVGRGSKKGAEHQNGHKRRMGSLCAMGLDRLFRFGFICIREDEVWLGRLIT